MKLNVTNPYIHAAHTNFTWPCKACVWEEATTAYQAEHDRIVREMRKQIIEDDADRCAEYLRTQAREIKEGLEKHIMRDKRGNRVIHMGTGEKTDMWYQFFREKHLGGKE